MKQKVLLLSLFLSLSTGCVPRVQVVAPEQAITINMNVKIEHQIDIKADDQVKQLLLQSKENTK